MSNKTQRAVLMLLAALMVMTASAFAGGGKEKPAKPAEIRYLAPNHPYTDFLKPILQEFTSKSGIKVNLENYEENQLNQKLTVEFTAGNSTVDVFMSRPLQEGRLFSKNKYYEFLDSYLNDSAKTAAEFDWKDYPQSTVNAVTFEGKVNSLPLNIEWETLFYRKDLFEQAGIKVPKTMEELEAAAKALHKPDKEMFGIVSRGQRGAAVTQFSSYLYGFGGDFIRDGKAVIDSPESVAALKFYGRLLAKYGPPGVTNMSFPQGMALFTSGKVAMWTDASVFIANVSDKAKSQVADKVGIAPVPAGPAGNKTYLVVPWSLAMGAQGKNKEAAWKFMQWAASKDLAKRALIAGMAMARSSAWKDPEVQQKLFPGMTDLIAQITPTAVPYDRPLMTAVVEARDAIGTVIVASINQAGEGDIAGMAKKAKEDVDKLLDKAGELKK